MAKNPAPAPSRGILPSSPICGPEPSQVVDLMRKVAKQKAEIARLTREADALRSERNDLRFALHKARAALRQAGKVTAE